MAAAGWRLKRNCSLTPRQALGAWSLPVAALLAVALFSAVQGWWWVVLFALLDTAGLAAALWRYSRHALDGDTLLLDDDGVLHIEQRDGERQRHTAWQASMVRIDAAEGEPITLRAGRAQLTVGAQVAAPQRELMAAELRRALRLGVHGPAR